MKEIVICGLIYLGSAWMTFIPIFNSLCAMLELDTMTHKYVAYAKN